MKNLLNCEAVPGVKERAIQNTKPPQCIAIAICNEVLEDKRTNNKSLIGLFNSIVVPGFPSVYPRMCVFASFTDGVGEWPVTFRILNPAQAEILRLEGKAQFDQPTAVTDLVLDIRGLPLPQEGHYTVEARVGQTLLHSRHFVVQKG